MLLWTKYRQTGNLFLTFVTKEREDEIRFVFDILRRVRDSLRSGVGWESSLTVITAVNSSTPDHVSPTVCLCAERREMKSFLDQAAISKEALSTRSGYCKRATTLYRQCMYPDTGYRWNMGGQPQDNIQPSIYPPQTCVLLRAEASGIHTARAIAYTWNPTWLSTGKAR